MVIARVIGNMVSSVKHDKHNGMKLMVVELIDPDGRPAGGRQIAVDCARAGVGDIVLLNTDGGAANILLGDLKNTIPVDCVICGVVDEIHIDKQQHD